MLDYIYALKHYGNPLGVLQQLAKAQKAALVPSSSPSPPTPQPSVSLKNNHHHHKEPLNIAFNPIFTPTKTLIRKCNKELHFLTTSPADIFAEIPRAFELFDRTFFDSRLGKFARAVGVTTNGPYLSGRVGDYTTRHKTSSTKQRLVIQIPAWQGENDDDDEEDGRRNSPQEILTILLREMAYIDYKVHNNNICRCEKCLLLDHSAEESLRFTEYLSQLNGVANFNLVGGEHEWRVSTHGEFEEMKGSVARLVDSTKDMVAVERLVGEKTGKVLERRNSI